MHRIDHQTAVGVMPDPKPAGIPGYFGRPNPALGIPATIVDADWLNMVQEELISVADAAGITPEKFKNDQLAQAIIQIARSVGIPIGGEKDMVLTKGSVTDGDVEWKFISGIPEGGEAGQVLIKKTAADKDVEWKHIYGYPVGSGIDHYGTAAPKSYLVCDGSAISRTAYPELYAVIGTKYGAGDGSTTFNLPNKINRFAQGSNTPGQYIAAGLPNITGGLGFVGGGGVRENYGAFYTNAGGLTYVHTATTIGATFAEFSAQRSNPAYGASGTVQPPALTVLPCIKYE